MIIQWIRRLLGLNTEQRLTAFELEHYQKFEKALSESDVSVYVYGKDVGNVVVARGSELHPVTPENLISFYKLNRRTRRQLEW